MTGSLNRTSVENQTTPDNLLAGQIRRQDFHLVQIGGEGKGRSFPLYQGEIVFGTSDGSDVLLTDRTASRKHCVINRTEDAIRIQDLNSTNGTRIEGVLVESAFLRPGNVIQIGTTVFAVNVGYAPIAGPAAQTTGGFRGLVGNSAGMKAIFSARAQLASANSTVLIQGETGTGKSALARSMHSASERRDSPFVVFDCAAVTPSLIESALFGHERGAFTGADKMQTGALENAKDGTLFIDELTELPLHLQPKLLRALEEREFTRVGGDATRKLHCRVIAASQHDVWALCEANKFRRDLYYRLAVVVVPIPSLRERKEDIKVIVDHLLNTLEAPYLGYNHLPEALRTEIQSYDWPGNIRELRNFLERYLVSPSTTQTPRSRSGTAGRPPLVSDVPEIGGSFSVDEDVLQRPYHEAKTEVIERFERHYLQTLLARTETVKEAATTAGLNRRYLHDLLLRHQLDKDDKE